MTEYKINDEIENITVVEPVKINASTWTRLIVLILMLLNYILLKMDRNPLPIHEGDIEEFLSLALMLWAVGWNHWKNNSYTKPAQIGDKVMVKIKEEKKYDC